jgi:hypothetical protein
MAETNRAVLIRIKNAADLARSQGALASMAQTLAPATIEARVYDELAKQLGKALADKRVEADVQVIDAPQSNWRPAGGTHLWTDIALALGGLGVLAILWRVFAGGKK